jgi:hypothetical protein
LKKKKRAKSILKAQIEKFPQDFSIDELIEKLTVIDKIERGNEQSANNETLSESKLNSETEEWFE